MRNHSWSRIASAFYYFWRADNSIHGLRKISTMRFHLRPVLQCRVVCQVRSVSSNLHYTCGITLKRVTSDGIHLGGLASRQHSYRKKRCSGGEPFATLRPI